MTDLEQMELHLNALFVHDERGRLLQPRMGRVRDLGDEPLYSTSWDNAASLRVAEKLGLIPYGEDLHFG